MNLLARKFIVLMPTRGTVTAETVAALLMNGEGHSLVVRMVHRKPVDVARNQLARDALTAADDPAVFERGADPLVFWIDSDAFFLKGTFSLMIREFETHPEIDVLVGYFGPRAPFLGSTAFLKADDIASSVVAGTNCVLGAVVPVEAAGLHFALHRASLLRRLGKEPFGPPMQRGSDDMWFCRRVREVGGRIAVATGIPVFHVDERNGLAFYPGARALVVAGDHIDAEAVAETPLPLELRSFGERVDRAKRTVQVSTADANDDQSTAAP